MPVASSDFMPAGSLTTPDVIACSAEPIAADMVCEPASMPPAAPTGKSNSLAPTTTSASPSTLETRARNVHFIASLPPLRCIRSFKLRLGRTAVGQLRQSLRTDEFQALRGVITMDLLHIELAHEINGFLRDDLAGHHDWKAGRIRNDESGGDQLRATHQAPIDLGVQKADVFTAMGIIGRVEATPDIAFVSPLASIAAEAVVKSREVWQVWYIRHKTLDARVEHLSSVRATLIERAIGLATYFRQNPDKLRDIATSVVDVGLEQNGIPRCLVDLNSVAVGEHSLELSAVISRRAAHQRYASRIEAELVFGQAMTRSHPVGAW